MAKKASIQAVAREAGVSVTTVSRTFAKPDLVLPTTRDKVMAAAHKLDYHISRSAAALKSGQSFRIALLISDDIATWFNAHVYAGLDSVLHPAGYDISVFAMSSAAQRREFFTSLPVRRNADAVVVCSFNIEPAEVRKLKAMNVPILGINIPSNDGFDAGVSIDDYAAERAAAEHLIALGHKRIAFIGYTDPRSTLRYSASARLKGLLDACAAHDGVEAMPFTISQGPSQVNDALNALVGRLPMPTAVATSDDAIAVPLLFRLRQYGRRVPEDMSVIGFDDAGCAADIGLTTLHQDPFAMGAAIARRALRLIGSDAAFGDDTFGDDVAHAATNAVAHDTTHDAAHATNDIDIINDNSTAFITPQTPLMLRDTTAPPANK